MGVTVKHTANIDLAQVIANLTTDKVLKVDWPERIRYPESEGGHYVAYIAAQNEYGNPLKKIPPRPFMVPAISANKTRWLEIFQRGISRILKGNGDIESVLEQVGRAAQGDVQKAIRAVTSPPLSRVTVERRRARYVSKGNKKKINPTTLEKPLIDTGVMLAAVTSAVEKE